MSNANGMPWSPDLRQRAAVLAVARYGADRSQVDQAVAALEGISAVGNVEILDVFVSRRVLTAEQAVALRRELEEPVTANGDAGLQAPVATPSGHYMRTLGEYRLLRRLGQGGMGSVYLGYHEIEKRYVAIKVLAEQLANNQDYVERFYREAKSGAMLDHPNMVRCIKAGRDANSGKHYLVLEYVDGPNAHGLIEKYGKLSVGDAVRISLDVARALEHAHSRSLIHRDIKPDNIMVTRSGVAKLADLGLAKRLDESSNLTSLRQGFGSLYYIPIEQAYDAKQADERSDIYALGATLYHLVSGEVPFPGASHMEIAEKKLEGTFKLASEFNGEVNEALDLIINKALARDAGQRYQMVSEMIVDLERSGLAAAVPSFADPELAKHDPLILANLQSARPTQLDYANLPTRADDATALEADTWYVRYRNGEGRWCKTKMTTSQVRDRIQHGRIPEGAEASRQPQGDFRALATYAELASAALVIGKGIMDAAVREKTAASKAAWWRAVLTALGFVAAAVGGAIAFALYFNR